MNRSSLFKAVEFAHAAAMNATLAASFDKIDPRKAAEYRRLSEDAFNAGIEALFEADLTFPAAIEQVRAAQPEGIAA